MNCNSTTVRPSPLIFGIAFLITMLSGCQTITDMDKPLAPEGLLWTKGPSSQASVKLALRDCGRQIQQNPQLMSGSSRERGDFNDICMLRKGFMFVRRPLDYGDICLMQAFRDGVACKSARGEYVVKPEDRIPDCYETGEWLNHGTCGGFVLDNINPPSESSISSIESENWRNPQATPHQNAVASKLEIGKALLECGQLTDSQPEIQIGRKIVRMSEGEIYATYRCMTQSGFVRVADWCKDNSHPACRPDAAVPQRSVERRRNSQYCRHFSKRLVCQL